MIWDYIEASFNGQSVRGFIPAGSIILPEPEADEPVIPEGVLD